MSWMLSDTFFFLLLGVFRSAYYVPWTCSRKRGRSMYSTCMCGVFLAKHTQRRSALSIWLTRLSHFSWLQPLGQWYLAGESKSCVSHVFKERGGNLPDTTERICPSQDTRYCVKEQIFKAFYFSTKAIMFWKYSVCFTDLQGGGLDKTADTFLLFTGGII